MSTPEERIAELEAKVAELEGQLEAAREREERQQGKERELVQANDTLATRVDTLEGTLLHVRRVLVIRGATAYTYVDHGVKEAQQVIDRLHLRSPSSHRRSSDRHPER